MKTTTFSLRVSPELLDRIDRSADRNGETRQEYVLSWLPDNYDSPATSEPGRRNAQLATA